MFPSFLGRKCLDKNLVDVSAQLAHTAGCDWDPCSLRNGPNGTSTKLVFPQSFTVSSCPCSISQWTWVISFFFSSLGRFFSCCVRAVSSPHVSRVSFGDTHRPDVFCGWRRRIHLPERKETSGESKSANSVPWGKKETFGKQGFQG